MYTKWGVKGGRDWGRGEREEGREGRTNGDRETENQSYTGLDI